MWLWLKLLVGKRRTPVSKIWRWCSGLDVFGKYRYMTAWFLPSVNFQLSSSSLVFTLEELLLPKPPVTFSWQKSSGLIPFLSLWASRPSARRWSPPHVASPLWALGLFCTHSCSWPAGHLAELLSFSESPVPTMTLINPRYLTKTLKDLYHDTSHSPNLGPSGPAALFSRKKITKNKPHCCLSRPAYSHLLMIQASVFGRNRQTPIPVLIKPQLPLPGRGLSDPSPAAGCPKL